ncbi:MAG: DUF1836 domain-containing protein [Sharpea porci]|uniref:DUF1836 domain-containing protein n=1 Tax=Sharpea porci TaxID=2652286 RepID=UPI002409B0EA|nr:DUF1836 domain-containing protein [Sharpea porci]MDD6710740.1 DUF1836 domain-containing protein [Sharpea porci]
MDSQYNHVHILRWQELPDFDLYMDQVIGLIEKSLSFLKLDEDDKIVTSTMINNYVKAKLVSPPIKKKYSREHVAYFTVICFLKRVFSLDEISTLLKIQFENVPLDESYNIFCDVLEALLINEEISDDIKVMDGHIGDLFLKVMRACVYAIHASRIIRNVALKKEEDEKKG